MLVVSRKAGEQVVIAGDIVLTVVRCGTNRVRLAIAAPPSVQVARPDAKAGPRLLVSGTAAASRTSVARPAPPPRGR